jgi:hypothetical protein
MNKTIYVAWFQGFEKAPDIVKQSINSWKQHNPDWTIIFLDNSNLSNYVNLNESMNISKKILTPQARSDIVRLCLLKTYGGLWVDATTFCNKPLDEWLPNYIQEGFFGFHKPAPDKLISSWFLYAEKDNYIINKWWESVIEYYLHRKSPHTYYWVHSLFGQCYKNDTMFKEIWDKVPKLSANGPHTIINKMFNPINPKIKEHIDKKATPLYKLTHRGKFPKYNESLTVYYLYSKIPHLPSA